MPLPLNDNIKSVIKHQVKARTTPTVPAYVDGAIAALADFAVNHCMNNLASTDVEEQTVLTVNAIVSSIITLCASGNKVPAIRLLRVYTGLGLADAKNAVEWLVDHTQAQETLENIEDAHYADDSWLEELPHR